VQGAFGVSESVYYCDAWNRSEGPSWHLDAALFFDQSGRLYKLGAGQPTAGTANAQGDAGEAPPGGPPAPRLPASRTGRRTPFADPQGLQ
jgi:hypothetical protein